MDSRREIAERIIARCRDRGRPIDTHPQFGDLLELWIAGSITMPEMRWRLLDLLRRDTAERRAAQLEDGKIRDAEIRDTGPEDDAID
ncbi:hypothetical protein [Rhizobium sp. 18065]|uniref:hypothetical protein n=1 Tax=Rhizobium sp. 18065 TaxID=2681411 RepID=UPI001359ABC8|nr:hypothetical protein [Rhizobium sp. 18065]